MANRASNLNVTAITIGATEYVTQAIEGTVSLNLEHDDGRGMGSTQAIYRAVAAKQNATANITVLRDQSAARITPLDLTVFTIGATSELGTMKSWNLAVETESQDGSAAADRWTFANRTGIRFTASGRLLATSSAPATRAAILGALSGTELTLTSTFGVGNTIALPMRLIGFSQQATRGEITGYDLEFVSNGTAPSISSTFPVFALAVGGGVVSPATFTYGDGGTLSGNWLVTSAALSIEDSQVVRESYTLVNRGVIALT
jgi:hypothetical protein